MNKIDEAISRIKKLECPTGDIENSVSLILEDYGVSGISDINVDRDKNLDTNEAQAYRVKIGGNQSFTVLARSGYDGYVAKVIDVLK